MTYLEEAAEQLRKARDENERRFAILPSLEVAHVPTEPLRAEVNARRMEIADGFIRLAAIKAGATADAILPHEAEMRIAGALSMLARYPVTDGDHHKTWIVDQVVRRLTGSVGGEETAEYLRFREEEDDWDEGIAP